MRKLIPLLCLAILMLAACAPTENGDPDAARTAAAQTLDAQLGVAQADQALETAEAEQTALDLELNLLETENAQLEIEIDQTQAAQATFAATEPLLIAPTGVTCRLGPNTGFGRAADIAAGSSVAITARSEDGEWWLAQLQDESECWVFWSSELGFEGDVFNLPLVQGPQLPTATIAPTREPGFALSFVSDHSCDGVSNGIFEVRNTGPETYESVRIRLFDVASDSQVRAIDGNNEFLASSNSCPKGNSTLGPSQTAFLAIPLSGTNDGDPLRISVRLCTENGLGGNCIAGNRQFTR